jgi:hypothetical protein
MMELVRPGNEAQTRKRGALRPRGVVLIPGSNGAIGRSLGVALARRFDVVGMDLVELAFE